MAAPHKLKEIVLYSRRDRGAVDLCCVELPKVQLQNSSISYHSVQTTAHRQEKRDIYESLTMLHFLHSQTLAMHITLCYHASCESTFNFFFLLKKSNSFSLRLPWLQVVVLQGLHRVNLSVVGDIKSHSFGFLGENSLILEKLHFFTGMGTQLFYFHKIHVPSRENRVPFWKAELFFVSRILQQNMRFEVIPSK